MMRSIALAILSSMAVFASECPSSDLSPPQLQARFRELDRKAQVEFRHADFAQASEHFREAACAAPDGIRAYYALYGTATKAVAGGDFVRARDVLREADGLRPDYPLPLAMLTKVNLIAGDMDGLKRCLLDAAHRFPHEAKLHAEMAQELLHENQTDLALAEGLRAGEGGASSAQAAMNLAVLENQAGAFYDAARLASQVQENQTFSNAVRASAAGIAGLSYESLGRYQEAVRCLKRAVELDPDQERPYLVLARIYAAQGDKPASAGILEEARQRIGRSPDIRLALGSALLSTEQYSAATRLLAGLIEDFPDKLEAYPKLAEAYREMGEPGRATETLQKLALRKPDYSMLHTVIARSLLDEQTVDYGGALHELDEAEKSSPDDYDVHYLRGKVFIATGKYARAADSLRRAIELRPAEPGAYYQLGLAYHKLGRLQLAKEQFDRLEFLKGRPASAK